MRPAGPVPGGSRVVLGSSGKLLETLGSSRRAQKAPGRLQEALGRLWELKMEAPGGGSPWTWHGEAGILGPPNTQKLNIEKPNTEH